ncbi:MAG: hypothetical protein J6C59_09555 [Muribaculaceae bacterium]|nr:hypothetical protein [Muribaculaceae bacterium]
MRELKFRGKPLDYDPMTMPEWMTGFYHQELYGGRILHLITDGATTFEVDPDTIGQYTGLCDKNGKEIYEGDILSANGRVVGWVKGGVRGYCYDVVYVNHPAGEKRWTLYATVMDDYKGKIEITGNIHDNPGLLNT